MDITILIPTKNRHFFIKRLLKYYKDFNYKGRIIIFDSSDLEIYKKNLKLVKVQKNKNISIIKYKALPFQCFKKFKHRINTKYICYSGDDDYFIINGLEKTIDKLKNTKNVIGANGKSLTFGLTGKKYNKSLSFGVYKNFSSNYKKSILRLDDLMQKYLVPLFSVFRTKVFLKMLDIVPDQNKLCPSRAVSDELLESFYITHLGRIININSPFLIRTVTDKEKGYSLDHQEYGFEKSYTYLKKHILINFKKKKEFYLLEKKLNNFFKNRKNILKSLDKKNNQIGFESFKKKVPKNFYGKIKGFFFLLRYKKFKLFLNVFKWIEEN